MLNLTTIFEHAIEGLREFRDALEVRPLPTVVYLMQCDVINQYEYALTHYFPISLSEHYLQNSSIGTPYDKWRKFTNDDFDLLAFTIHNLIRYTSRLIYETVGVGLEKQGRFREIKTLMRDDYTGPLCDIKYRGRKIGIQILPENDLETTAFAKELVPVRTEIGNREILAELCARGRAEIDELKAINLSFGQLCSSTQRDGPIHVPFESLNQSWWV